MENCKVSRSTFILLFLTGIQVIGTLGHFLISVVSRDTAQDIGYGDQSCLAIPNVGNSSSSAFCTDYKSKEICVTALVTNSNGSEIQACEWNYNGLGTEYQMLIGPPFVLCFTVSGIIWGILADKWNRVHLLGIATLLFSFALAGTAFATEYWQLVLFRMALATGEGACGPLGAGIISNVFPQDELTMAMGIFNAGIYIGHGASFAVGYYGADTTFFDEKWRTPFLISGIPGTVIGVIFLLSTTEPRNIKKKSMDSLGNNNNKINYSSSFPKDNEDVPDTQKIGTTTESKNVKRKIALIELIQRPEIFILIVAACIRFTAGFCWYYNSALYFQTYYPEYDCALWLTGITIFGAALGSIMGGYISDRLVIRFGISTQALVLAGSQLISAPFTLAMLYLDPPYTFLPLFLGNTISQMYFGILFAILVELVPVNFRSSAVGIVLFIMFNVGGNLPIFVDSIAAATDYRTAIAILYPGALLASSVLFFLCWVILRMKET